MSLVREVVSILHSENVVNCRAWCCKWRHDGKLLLTTGEDRTVKVWSFDHDSAKLSLVCQLNGDHLRTIRYAEFSPCGRYIVSASFDSSMRIYEKDDGLCFDEKHRLDGHEHEIKCASFSPSGRYLASASRDKNVFVWQIDEDEDMDVDAVLQSHTGDVKCVAWHPDEEFLASSSYDMTINVYRNDGSDWVVHQTLSNAHDETVWMVAFDPSGKYFVSVGGDSMIKVWTLIRGNSPSGHKWVHFCSLSPPNSRWPIYAAAWDLTRNIFACGGGDRKLWVYEVADDGSINLLFDYPLSSDINSISFHPKVSGLLSLCTDESEVIVLQMNV